MQVIVLWSVAQCRLLLCCLVHNTEVIVLRSCTQCRDNCSVVSCTMQVIVVESGTQCWSLFCCLVQNAGNWCVGWYNIQLFCGLVHNTENCSGVQVQRQLFCVVPQIADKLQELFESNGTVWFLMPDLARQSFASLSRGDDHNIIEKIRFKKIKIGVSSQLYYIYATH